ncbi:hypothetical protein [Streptomyces sp. NPDC101455]|uniref:hypothetical protein n=1 Tax=Streptomyces sp. NPDC101455 TaxID=3366142 RepID=UPI003800B4A4
MTATPTRVRRTRTKAANPPNSVPPQASSPEAEFRRWKPSEVAALKLLPYSERVIREKCYKRLLFCHRDGGRITFTAEDLRRNAELGAQPAA